MCCLSPEYHLNYLKWSFEEVETEREKISIVMICSDSIFYSCY